MARTTFRVMLCSLVAACSGEAATPDSSAQLPAMIASGPAANGASSAAASGLAGRGPGASGPGASGPGASGSGASGPAVSGPGTSGPAASGPGASGPGVNGPGSGPAANAAGSAPPSGPASASGATLGAAGAAASPAVAAAGAGGADTDGAGDSAARQSPPSAAPTGPLFPANGADNVCADASLHLRFDAKPTLGSGKISVFEKGNSTPVASVDVSAGTSRVSPGGTQLTFTQPVFVVDKEVIVQLPAALGYGKTYYVTVDAGAVRGTGGAMPLGGEGNWQFTTRAAALTNLTSLRVAVDGTGDFCSVQAGLEAAASGATVTLGRGYYHELIHVSGKTGVTLRGDDRKATVILGVNNDKLNSGTAKRALVNIEKSSDLIIERLTIKNTTPQDGSQAEALRLQSCDKCVVRDADIISLQDTLLWSGRIYAKNCYIAGNVDFVWGTGAVYFDQCEIKTLGRKGYVVQSRNEPGEYGYVFVDSKITADSGVSGIILARIDVSTYPGSHVAYVSCEMGKHIAPEGWTITGGVAGASLRFWEYQSKDAAGGMLDVSRRVAGSQQISAAQAATMRDPSKVLGGWMPPQ